MISKVLSFAFFVAPSLGMSDSGRFFYPGPYTTDGFPVTGVQDYGEMNAYRGFTVAAEVFPEFDDVAAPKIVFGNDGPFGNGAFNNMVISARESVFLGASWHIEFGEHECWTRYKVVNGEWQHVALVFEWEDMTTDFSGMVTLYVNGESRDLCFIPRYGGHESVLLGASTEDFGLEPINPWIGKMRNFQGWSRPLSPNEMRVLAHTPDVPLTMVNVVPAAWRTVMGCDALNQEEEYRVYRDNVADLAKEAMGLRICTTGTEDCVTATPVNGALGNLASGSLSLMPNMGSCQKDCVDKLWTGPSNLRAHMAFRCRPNRGHMFYHACGNTQGLHLDSRSLKQCTWDWGNKEAISIQLLLETTPSPTPLPTPTPTFSPTPPTPAPVVALEQRDFDSSGKKLVQSNVCFGANADQFGELTIPKDMAVSGIYLVHRSGGVANVAKAVSWCQRQAEKFGTFGQGKSNFGGECEENVAVHITDASDNLIVPNSRTAGFTPQDNGWYNLDGFNSHSKYLGFEQNMNLHAGSYRIWHGEDLSDKSSQGDNSGTSCVDVYVAEKRMPFEIVGGSFDSGSIAGAWLKVGPNVCMGARDDSFGSFTIPFGIDLVASEVWIGHRSGYVNCQRPSMKCDINPQPNGQSKFGCECFEAISLIMTTGENKRILPDDKVSMNWNLSYDLPGYNSHSDYITFDTVVPFSTGEYRLWYSEDLSGKTEYDNSGRACYDVWAKVSQ